MKKIIGFQNKGGESFMFNVECCDKELIELVGKEGINKMMHDIKQSWKDRAKGFEGYTTEEVLDGIQEIIDKAIMEKNAI